MGDASRNIISDWGIERFGQGLSAAAEQAMGLPPKGATFLDRVLLSAVMSCRQ
jgi:hypothetical protein